MNRRITVLTIILLLLIAALISLIILKYVIVEFNEVIEIKNPNIKAYDYEKQEPVTLKKISNGYILYTQINDENDNTNVKIIKYDNDFNILWEKFYNADEIYKKAIEQDNINISYYYDEQEKKVDAYIDDIYENNENLYYLVSIFNGPNAITKIICVDKQGSELLDITTEYHNKIISLDNESIYLDNNHGYTILNQKNQTTNKIHLDLSPIENNRIKIEKITDKYIYATSEASYITEADSDNVIKENKDMIYRFNTKNKIIDKTIDLSKYYTTGELAGIKIHSLEFDDNNIYAFYNEDSGDGEKSYDGFFIINSDFEVIKNINFNNYLNNSNITIKDEEYNNIEYINSYISNKKIYVLFNIDEDYIKIDTYTLNGKKETSKIYESFKSIEDNNASSLHVDYTKGDSQKIEVYYIYTIEKEEETESINNDAKLLKLDIELIN